MATRTSGPESAPAGEAKRTPTEPATEADALEAIARDIQKLGSSYPQLRAFRAREHFDRDALTIRYEHHTDPPNGGGGWTGAVPDPRPDGLWLHIDFHDPSSTAQIHTQPIVPPLHFKTKRVLLLLREGEATAPLTDALHEILERHGVQAGPPP